MISRKLLQKILGGYSYFPVSQNNKEITYSSDAPDYRGEKYSLNIFETAHMCKEWAFKEHGIDIRTNRRTFGFVAKLSFGKVTEGEQVAETEPEAIFAACEWILEQKDKK